jgi:hypothetical protein
MAVDVGAEKPSGEWHSAHDLTRTLICGRPGCDRELEAGDVEGDLCLACKLRLRDQPGTDLPGKRQAHELPDRVAASPSRSAADPAKAVFTCQTPECGNPASSSWGRHSFCRSCQVERGTRTADGSLASGKTRQREARRRPRRGKRSTAPPREAVAAATEGTDGTGAIEQPREGPSERAALELVALARRVDLALAGLEAAREEADAAAAEWRDAVEAMAALPVELAVAGATHGRCCENDARRLSRCDLLDLKSARPGS